MVTPSFPAYVLLLFVTFMNSQPQNNNTNVTNSTNNTNSTNSTNSTNNSNVAVPINLTEVEVLPSYPLPKLEYALTPEQKYELAHPADPNEFVEEFTVGSASAELHREQLALRHFYHVTNGIFWLRNWDFSVPSLCGQFGVQCTMDGQVTHLLLRANNLTGRVPEIFFDFPYLIELDLSLNFLSGPINFLLDLPTFFQVIRLSNNQFSGPIPNELFQFWYVLRVFEAENNYLNGTFPHTFGWQRALLEFRVSKNELGGVLPLKMGHPISLQVFAASHNRISGGFPESLQDLSDDLEVLVLSHNQLRSTFPSKVLNKFEKLKILAVNHNELFGEVGNLQKLEHLEVLWLHNNLFDGNTTNLVNATTNKRLQDMRIGGNYLQCEVYKDRALVHTDSPKDQASCQQKEYIHYLNGTRMTVIAIP